MGFQSPAQVTHSTPIEKFEQQISVNSTDLVNIL